MDTPLVVSTAVAFAVGLISAVSSSKRRIDLRAAYAVDAAWVVTTPASIMLGVLSISTGFVSGSAWLIRAGVNGSSAGGSPAVLVGIGIVGACFFGVLGVYVVAAWVGPLHGTSRVRVDVDGVEVARPFRDPVFVRWRDVVEIVDCGPASSHSRSGTEVRYRKPGGRRGMDSVVISDTALGLKSSVVTDVLQKRRAAGNADNPGLR